MTPSHAERCARLRLLRAADVGDLRLLEHVRERGAEEMVGLLRAGSRASAASAEVVARLDAVDPESEIAAGHALGARFVIPGDAEWPNRLHDLARITVTPRKGGVPLGLWVRGPLGLDELEHSLSIVGTRAATPYGTSVAAEIAATCASVGLVVVSGAAFGVDYAAHRGAVTVGGHTVAVLACGVDKHYPVQHEEMLEHLARTSAVVSEAPLGAHCQRQRFLARNRIIVALTQGTVVVEAALRSGALNSAEWADKLMRPAMGVPGPVTSGVSSGVNDYVRNGKLTLVTRGEEVLEQVSPMGVALLAQRRGEERAYDALDEDQQKVFEVLPARDALDLVSIAREALMDRDDAAFILGELARGEWVINEGDDANGPWRITSPGVADRAAS
ncbi:MAG: DNA-processing protein DprA [Nocardioides sp.]|jgi:DNA processing protein